MSFRIAAIIQARMGSGRLPGKVLERIGEWPVLHHVIARVRHAVAETFVVTPGQPEDEPITELCRDLGCTCVSFPRLDPNDVLGRFASLIRLRLWPPDLVVRITADCPFVSPDAIRQQLRLHTTCLPCPAYSSNARPTRSVPDGYDVEVIRADALEQLDREVTDPYDRQHVTPALYRHERQGGLPRWPLAHHRWTLDTPEDLAWFRRIAEEIDVTPPHHPTLDELLDLIRRKPELAHFNEESPAATGNA